jgi:hypothetical protein
VRYLRAPRDWTPADPNPFTEDGRHGAAWTCFCLDPDVPPLGVSGCGPNGLFVFRIASGAADVRARLADFLRYENARGRSPIVACLDGSDVDAWVGAALTQTPEPHLVRPSDPLWVVHSTTLEAWRRIQAEGVLKCGRLVAEAPRLGQTALGEPPDYDDYIILGDAEVVYPECVVASQQGGRIVVEPDADYSPGARLYLDNHRIIREGLGVRDGLHLMKVLGRLPLHSFLTAALTVRDLDLPPGRTGWTPNTFFRAANEEFRRRIGGG